MCDGRTLILPDGGTGTVPEHTTAVSIVSVAGGGSPEAVGGEARLADATPMIPDDVLTNPSTVLPPQCQAPHHQNPTVTIMQPENTQELGNNNDRIIIKFA